MIKLKNVSKIYPNGARALFGVNLDVAKGDFVFLVGASGAGKSTLIKLLYREEIATRGQVLIDNVNLVRMSSSHVPLVRRKIGVIFQDFKLLPAKTVFENVAFAQQVIGKSMKETRENTDTILDLVGLAKKKNAFPSELSGGEQQRTCIARALVNKPALLVADEPTGNLDVDTSWSIMELLNHVNKLGTTVVMATHARYIIEQMNKRVIRIEEGKIVDDSIEGAYRIVT
ncbi:Cell division transporter, ATP-binding protein FtsE [Dehalobacter sp. UNSWDHB]|jgi:cell division ATP-binding protein FtsE|uniref:cell division ATP-binding protein FtsE n=1 Tax=unclassified Dehalobacter TaxID=2635733 RepID=UPI00028AF2A9|nr:MULTISPECIES: cell division ATP-binding protein FtsE [unclassified Dehalobacter]AFV03877.1 Cell division transporter, ATP-binding protein FtsE [Dehalobacter sp. DCA]AFV06855.1 Cell division transporter, ATP-binding protein FtsE [Dehalobacter sp. CF]EQB21387.1 Cell division transporter, ATP-binding protein FtsE [Dehalobacter sp. UNSWDHB]